MPDLRILIIAGALAVAGGACGQSLKPQHAESRAPPIPQLVVMPPSDLAKLG